MGGELINVRLECADPLYREIESKLWYAILKDDFGDDEIIEPWVTVEPAFASSGWGFDTQSIEPELEDGAYKLLPCIREMDEIRNLKVPKHEIDRLKTNERYARVEEAIGDIIQVDRGRGTAYTGWGGDISTHLARLVGLEELMYYVYDRPEWMHELLAFMRDGILKSAAGSGGCRRLDAYLPAQPGHDIQYGAPGSRSKQRTGNQE
jgi:hypothetical protein